MAVFYNKEKSKLGSLTGTIISFARELISTDPKSTSNKYYLPAGYLRCDGSVLSANEYPSLAEVLGTGSSCKFKKPSQNLNSDQFQLPDLRNKHIRTTTSANIGQYNDLFVQDQEGNNVVKSGIGLDVISNIESPYELTYNGSFYIPPQEVPLRGEPAFTIDSGSYTYETEVPATAFQPHLHRTSTSRARQKDKNGNFFSSRQLNSVKTKSSLNVCQWWENTRQELCYWQITTASVNPPPGRQSFSTSYQEQYGACWYACNGFTTQGYCLWPSESICPEVDNKTWNIRLSSSCNNGQSNNGQTTTFGNITYDPTWTQNCVCTAPIFGACPGGTNGTSTGDINSSILENYNEINLPFTSTDSSNYSTGYAAVSNITTLSGDTGDEGIHRHRLNFNSDEAHAYKMITRAATARADSGIKSSITIDVNTSSKADKYIQQYIVTEYLIKI